MRVSLAFTGLAVLLLAGCGGAPDDEARTAPASESPAAAPATTDMNMSAGDSEAVERTAKGDSLAPLSPAATGEAPPEITPDSAPDVAFAYRFRFGLAADHIAPVQQRHARLCEELGAERCRVTGMSYHRRDEDRVDAELRLMIEPGLAHRFGERALDGVREADGKLVDSQVNGTDVGSGIRASTRTIAQLEEELAELEARIARGGSVGTLRDLRYEATALRDRIRALRGDRSGKREQLANTPMALNYETDAFASGSPDFGSALETAWVQVKWIAYGLFTLLMVLAPWIVGGMLVWLALRVLGRRRRRAEAAATAGPAI